MKTYNTQQQLEQGLELDQDCFFFYDWFCKDSSLERKAKALLPKVRKFIEASKVDTSTTYFWFKNNCPILGSLYDDFRISDCKTQDVIWTVVPQSGHKSMGGKGELWGAVNDFDKPLIVGSFDDILNYFKTQH